MKTQFASIWAVKSDMPLTENDTVMVSLKSGAQKPVTVTKFLYETTRKSDGAKAYFYLSAKDKDDSE